MVKCNNCLKEVEYTFVGLCFECANRKERVVKYEDKSQDILDMIKYARHIHAGNENNIDTCKKCGHDIRHGIHFRYGENINEYTNNSNQM